MAYRFSNFTNIVALRRTKQSVISLTPARQLESYWTSLRDGGDVPMRTRIDPRGIANILPHAFMIERLSPSVASIRLAGQHLNQLVDGEARGLPFGLIFAPKARSSVATAINAVLDTPAIAQFDLRSTGSLVTCPCAPGSHCCRCATLQSWWIERSAYSCLKTPRKAAP